jgi:CHAT domain-containing protein
MVSSYTPTIGALLTHNPTPSAEPFKMMVVVQSQELPSTKRELAKIEQYVSKDSLIKLGVPGQTASVESVASRLSDVSIAHFACHGKQDRSNPLDSGLKLEDGMLLVSRIMKEPMPNGSLAFLCACETAMGDGNLPDEAMSLAASLLFAGFRHVIATMW